MHNKFSRKDSLVKKIVFLFLIFGFTLRAQSFLHVGVYDAATLEPLAYVNIALDSSFVSHTDFTSFQSTFTRCGGALERKLLKHHFKIMVNGGRASDRNARLSQKKKDVFARSEVTKQSGILF